MTTHNFEYYDKVNNTNYSMTVIEYESYSHRLYVRATGPAINTPLMFVTELTDEQLVDIVKDYTLFLVKNGVNFLQYSILSHKMKLIQKTLDSTNALVAEYEEDSLDDEQQFMLSSIQQSQSDLYVEIHKLNEGLSELEEIILE